MLHSLENFSVSGLYKYTVYVQYTQYYMYAVHNAVPHTQGPLVESTR